MNPTHRFPTLAAAVTAALLAAAGLSACKREAAPAPTTSAPQPAAAQAPAAPADDDPAALQRAADSLMKQQYGDAFDATQRCWKFAAHFDGGQGGNDYCMRAAEPQLIELQGQRRLYLAAASVADAPAYSYGHAEPGLMGAFVLGPDSRGGWTLLAGDKQLALGSSGNCGCQDAQLVRIGAGTMAWKFASGGVWQGTVVSYYSLIAPLDGKIAELSAIPQITEDDQNSEYSIAIDDSDTAKAMFPLRVTKRSNAPGSQDAHSEQVVEFDPAKRTYALPETK
ncbi:hypothetical protein [Lysobacter enzymogenes]|uniref:Lipoprotein n=1 Tax=Lysobacter enzymogenes TaxID=69 RepID=A0AAU9AIE2_LYSEN|nr:hypothetical protein [Lysobacter enzymogenes]BAV98436.1 hypothetical protein LEN_2949 [Lysobacter enzymogenes]